MLMDNPIQNYIPDQRGTASFAQRRMGKQRTLLSLIWDYWFQRYCDGKWVDLKAVGLTQHESVRDAP